MKLKTLLTSVLILCATALAHAQFARVDGRQVLGRDGRPFAIKGTSLGNWFVPEGYMWRLDGGANSPREIEALVEVLLGPDKAQAFWREFRQRYVTRADIEFLARTGANTLRVPLHYKFFLEENSDGFQLLDRVVTWAREANLSLVLDMHCAPGGQTGTNIDDSRGYPWLFASPSAQAQFVAVWERIARHYRNEPVVLGYELLNEPLPAFPGWEKFKPLLEPLQRRALEAIRAIDPNHIVVLTGANWDSDFSVLGQPFAANVIYTFHKYWMPPTVAAIREYLDFRERYNVPLWCSETGENKDPWVQEFRQVLEASQVGWTFWPYKKMQSTAGFVRYAPPPHWEKVVAFGKQPQTTGSDRVKANLAVRPTDAEIEEAFAALLQSVDVSRCEPNRGYIEALGLKVPAP